MRIVLGFALGFLLAASAARAASCFPQDLTTIPAATVAGNYGLQADCAQPVAFASTQSSPGNPTGTTSTTAVMMGLAGSITPKSSGKLLIVISGTIANSTSGDGATAQISYGTGTAPLNAAALTGTQAGNAAAFTAAAAAQKVPFTTSVIVSGLTVGTAYWLDLAVAAVTGGTASASGLSVSAYELP